MKTFLTLLLIVQTLSADLGNLPVSSFGRFRTLEVHAKLFLQENHMIAPSGDSVHFIWELNREGPEKFMNQPIFRIAPTLRKNLQLPKFVTPKEIEKHLNEVSEELRQFFFTFQNAKGSLIFALPSKREKGKWFPFQKLSLKNFTPYSDETYEEAQKLWEKNEKEKLTDILTTAYTDIAGKTYLRGARSELSYPTTGQLTTEKWLEKAPWLLFVGVGYFLAAIFFLLSSRLSFFSSLAPFAMHTAVILARCYVLERPPVANMYETMIYVPWIALFLSYLFKRTPLILLGGLVGSGSLLVILSLSSLQGSLENVQPVLNSQFWLSIHVLMVVGSYGVFILSAVLAHLYLIRGEDHKLAKPILHTLLIGTALLIGGTILGGVWAAQSWGRFWDWDPKESWAFISSALYLVLIHAYRFGKIGPFGLSIGSILGLQAIIFTWYGVNYLLGTGLHSYGFGSGGLIYYGIFVTLEALFIVGMGFKKKLTLKKI